MHKPKKFLKIQYFRKVYDISGEEMAKVIGKSWSAYCAKERGESQFTLDEFLEILNTINKLREKDGLSKLTAADLLP